MLERSLMVFAVFIIFLAFSACLTILVFVRKKQKKTNKQQQTDTTLSLECLTLPFVLTSMKNSGWARAPSAEWVVYLCLYPSYPVPVCLRTTAFPNHRRAGQYSETLVTQD